MPRRVWLCNGCVDEPDCSLFRGWTPATVYQLSVLGYKWPRGQWVIVATAPGIVVGGCFSLLLGVRLRANGGVGAATAEPRPCDRPAAFLRSAGASPAARCCPEAAASGVTGSKFPSSRHAKKCMREARATLTFQICTPVKSLVFSAGPHLEIFWKSLLKVFIFSNISQWSWDAIGCAFIWFREILSQSLKSPANLSQRGYRDICKSSCNLLADTDWSSGPFLGDQVLAELA